MVQTVGQITGLLSTNSSSAFSLYDDQKARKSQRDWISKLKQDSKRQALINNICSRLDEPEHSSEDVDESWTIFKDTVHYSAMVSLGTVSCKHQDGFDENDKESRNSLKSNIKKKRRHVSVIPTQHLIRLPIQTYVRVQTRLRDTQGS